MHSKAPFLRRVVVVSSALALGGMLGSLGVVGRDLEGLKFEFHWSVPILFAVGAVLAVLFWRVIFQFDAGASVGKNKLLKLSGGTLLLIAFGCFLFPLRLVSEAKRLEVIWGLSSALVVLSGFGWIIFNTIQWVEASSRDEEQRAEADADHSSET